jgi:hypothetical protein|tara:strand:+ start:369 stop:953 length:585 start_codon:yes stop_codon:yes gene_type:complete
MITWPVDELFAALIFMVIFLIAYAVQRVPKEEKIETPPPTRRSRSVPAPKKLNPYAELKKRTGTPRVLFSDNVDTKDKAELEVPKKCLPKSMLDMPSLGEDSLPRKDFLPGGFVDQKSAALMEKNATDKKPGAANENAFVVPKDAVRMTSSENTSSSEESSADETPRKFNRKPQRVRKSMFKKTGRVVVGKHSY